MSENRISRLAEARKELTEDRILIGQLEAAMNKLRQSGSSPKPINAAEQKRTFAYCEAMATEATGTEAAYSPELLKEVSELYFSVGEMLTPFYQSFARWVGQHRDNEKPTEFIFQGRDSLGFLIAFAEQQKREKRDRDWSHSSITRRTHQFYGLDSEPAVAEMDRLKQEYDSRGYLDKKLVFVDFGFKGSNPRKELLLIHNIFGRMPSSEILLAYRTDDNRDSLGDYIWNNFSRESRSTYERLNAKLIQQTNGYINSEFPDFKGALDDDPYFREILQELSSSVREAPPKNFVKGKRDFLVTTVHELAGKHSFLRGVVSRTKSEVSSDHDIVAEALSKFHDLYSQFPGLFTMMNDFSTRYVQDGKMRNMIKKLNDDLEGMGEDIYVG